MMVKSELVAEFAEECVELLTASRKGWIPFIEFCERYYEHFERRCRATDYGFEDLEDLFRAIPNAVTIVEDKGARYVPPHLRQGPGRRVQLTRCAMFSDMDLPELSLEVVDVKE